MRIRDYHCSDLPYLYDICLRTGDSGGDASALYSDPYMVGQYFAAPYAARDPRCVLVLEDAAKPVGYVLGTDDTVAYLAWFDGEWRPRLALMYAAFGSGTDGLSQYESWLRGLIAEVPKAPAFSDAFPGHLHIDILPEGQGKGWGSRLVDAFRARLAELGCPGLHLGVSRSNRGAVRFYERYGMEELGGDEHTLFLGIGCR